MAGGRYQFDSFSLDPVERRLFAGDELVELNSRYFDALLLLLQHPGTLLSKERFLQEVWKGIPVTDEVLTQCIRALRRQLGDSATRPHLIETVPKHGYRFIAPVQFVGAPEVAAPAATARAATARAVAAPAAAAAVAAPAVAAPAVAAPAAAAAVAAAAVAAAAVAAPAVAAPAVAAPAVAAPAVAAPAVAAPAVAGPEVEHLALASQAVATAGAFDWRQCWLTLGAGTTGGGVAGLLGGLAFGFAAASQAQQSGIGALSALLVLVALATLLALIGAAGVVGGIAAARLVARDVTFAGLVGGAVGGLLVGAFGKLVGHDAFLLLSGQSPGDITGALEGLLLGAAVGLADDLGRRFAADWNIRRTVLLATATGALAGLLIAMTGGHLLAGSLALLAESFPGALLHLDPLSDLLGPLAAGVTNTLEGAWFSLCLVGALMLVRGRAKQ